MQISTFKEAQQFLYSLIPKQDQLFPGDLGVARMKALMHELGNPEKSYPVIHVAGTSGKGSTCTFLSYIFAENGYTTGLHLSPHIISIKERMQINNQLPSDNEFVEAVWECAPAIEKTSNLDESNFGKVSYFEATTAIALWYFAKKKADIVILETGLGGLLDATNIVDSQISVITPIGLDHTRILGATHKKIALQKAGIIKNTNIAVVSSEQVPEAEQVLAEVAQKNNVRVYFKDKDFTVEDIKVSLEKTEFKVKDLQCTTKMIGAHQAHNAGLAIYTAQLFKESMPLTPLNIQKGVAKAVIPGRFEIIHKDGITYILDGAHNEDKMKALTRALKDLNLHNLTLIFACKHDKDSQTMIHQLKPYVSSVIATQFLKKQDLGKKLASDPEELAKIFVSEGVHDIVAVDDPAQALAQIKELELKDTHAVAKHPIVLVTGSLYLVSEIRAYLI